LECGTFWHNEINSHAHSRLFHSRLFHFFQMTKPLSSKRSEAPACCLIPFFAFFLVIGGLAFLSIFVRPLLGVLQARNWTPTPCRITSSAVVTKGSGDDRKFYPDILYFYSVGGTRYNSTRWNPFDSSTSRAQAQRIVQQFPAGTNAQCYVNPNDPTQAMLDRSIPLSAWLGLVPLLFVAIGAGGIIWQIVSLRTAKTNRALAQSSWQPRVALLLGAGPNLVLKPTTSRIGNCIGLTIFAVIWNGFVFAFFWTAVLNGSPGSFFRVFLALFLIPFALIGLLILGGAFSSFLGLFNAGLQLTLNRIDAAPGEELELSWQMQRGQIKPQELRITLQAREEATYRRGTDTVTDKNIFHKNEIVHTAKVAEIQSGQARIPIPANTMHSMEATNNKIIWSLKVRGAVRLWPDIDEEYVILVVPQRSVS
jgi:hypothetical protein